MDINRCGVVPKVTVVIVVVVAGVVFVNFIGITLDRKTVVVGTVVGTVVGDDNKYGVVPKVTVVVVGEDVVVRLILYGMR